MKASQVVKILSANDVGATGTHQSGILVQKDAAVLEIFPKLDGTVLNPRAALTARDQADHSWGLTFIYYNNRLFGGTRNEYRLTRLTKYFRANGVVEGDSLILGRDERGEYHISFTRSSPVQREGGRLTLSGGWRIIPIRRTK